MPQLIQRGLYKDLALALYSGPFWPASVALVTLAFGAVEAGRCEPGFCTAAAMRPPPPPMAPAPPSTVAPHPQLLPQPSAASLDLPSAPPPAAALEPPSTQQPPQPSAASGEQPTAAPPPSAAAIAAAISDLPTAAVDTAEAEAFLKANQRRLADAVRQAFFSLSPRSLLFLSTQLHRMVEAATGIPPRALQRASSTMGSVRDVVRMTVSGKRRHSRDHITEMGDGSGVKDRPGRQTTRNTRGTAASASREGSAASPSRPPTAASGSAGGVAERTPPPAGTQQNAADAFSLLRSAGALAAGARTVLRRMSLQPAAAGAPIAPLEGAAETTPRETRATERALAAKDAEIAALRARVAELERASGVEMLPPSSAPTAAAPAMAAAPVMAAATLVAATPAAEVQNAAEAVGFAGANLGAWTQDDILRC